jgi:hypothetical protein
MHRGQRVRFRGRRTARPSRALTRRSRRCCAPSAGVGFATQGLDFRSGRASRRVCASVAIAITSMRRRTPTGTPYLTKPLFPRVIRPPERASSLPTDALALISLVLEISRATSTPAGSMGHDHGHEPEKPVDHPASLAETSKWPRRLHATSRERNRSPQEGAKSWDVGASSDWWPCS